MCTSLVFLGLCTGYAAFSTGVSLSVKGNIVYKTITVSELKSNIVTSADGLYEDYTMEGRYIYRGINPNNYIKLGDDIYRIIAIKKDNALKVVRDKNVGGMMLDNMAGVDSRKSTKSNDYCYNYYGSTYYGCNVWGSKTTMLDKNENNVTAIQNYNLPEKEATLNTYLNNDWYGELDENVKNVIVSHTFNVGTILNERSISDVIMAEQTYKWRGDIGIINMSDYLKANTNTEKCGSIT